ncbi:MAG: DNA repair protein RecN [Armatimonadota bacterium]
MIHQLYVRDFAVIDEISLEFGPGLNILTGETGSGKSVIVDAISVALGERADTESVRSGCEKAIVEAVLDISTPETLAILEEAGFTPEDGCIVVSREVQRSGKSQCRINGRPSTVSLLKEITDHLVDTHGQHEHQFLLRPERHVEVLDAWCGPEAAELCGRVAEGYSTLRKLREELDGLRTDARERARLTDLYQFQADEISAAKLSPGEEEELLADRIRLANAEKLHSAAAGAYELLSGEGSVIESLGEAAISVGSIAELDESLSGTVESLRSALYGVEDAARALREYRDAVEFNPERLEDVEERIDLIRTLKKKYGESVEEIIAYGAGLAEKLSALETSDERAAQIEKEIEKLKDSVTADAKRLSEERRKGGAVFSKAIEGELASLGMQNAVFQMRQEEVELSAGGVDRIEFLFSANPGEPPRPLAKIASGGEMSRVMLAIKSVMSDEMPTLVFDEIDVGVGGRTAEVIAEKLQGLAERAQVLCITHLPQVACGRGDHFGIEKELAGGRTVVRVRRLVEAERVEEIARMLGGSNPSQTAVQHAKEMLGV